MEEHNSQKLGRGMLTLTWILILAGLTYIFGIREEKQYNPNTNLVNSENDGVRQVTLKRNKYHHYVASGTINNKPVVFMLDTGATDVVIPENVAQKLDLARGASSYAVTANGTVQVFQTRIPQLGLGPIVLHDVRASINPHMEGDGILLGMSVLKQLEFSQSGDELTLRQY